MTNAHSAHRHAEEAKWVAANAVPDDAREFTEMMTGCTPGFLNAVAALKDMQYDGDDSVQAVNAFIHGSVRYHAVEAMKQLYRCYEVEDKGGREIVAVIHPSVLGYDPSSPEGKNLLAAPFSVGTALISVIMACANMGHNDKVTLSEVISIGYAVLTLRTTLDNAEAAIKADADGKLPSGIHGADLMSSEKYIKDRFTSIKATMPAIAAAIIEQGRAFPKNLTESPLAMFGGKSISAMRADKALREAVPAGHA